MNFIQNMIHDLNNDLVAIQPANNEYEQQGSASTCSIAFGESLYSPDQFINTSSIDKKDLLYKSDRSPVRKKTLTREEVQYDVSVLIMALEQAYSGSKYLPSGIYEDLVQDIQNLGKDILLGATVSDGDLFCAGLAKIFWKVPDKHLYTPRSCRSEIKIPTPTNVGGNINSNTGYYFETRTANGKKIGILSLGTSMPAKEDRCWLGFEKQVAKITKETDALIIDLRGNAGGMSDNIRWLASYLYGNPAKMLDETIIMRRSAAAKALEHNEAMFEIINALENEQPVQKYLIDFKKDALKEFLKLEKKEPDWEERIRKGSNANFNPKKGYNKPIRILINKGCASACEGGFARFLSHPQVKTYGTNTSGAYHYGDTMPLVLPKSGVFVSIPTSARKFPDNRFIEKIGYAPDVYVPDGKDALEVVMSELAGTK